MKKRFVCFSLSSTLQVLQEGVLTIERVYTIISRTKLSDVAELQETHGAFCPLLESKEFAVSVWERLIQPRFFLSDESIYVASDEFLCLDNNVFYDVWRLREDAKVNSNQTTI